MSSRWVGLRARDPRLCRLPRFSPSGVVAAHSITYRGGSASASHRLPCSIERISLRRSISSGFDEAAFNPRKRRNRTVSGTKVNLPRVPIAQPPCIAASGKRIADQVLATHVENVIHTKAQAESTFKHEHAHARCEHSPGRHLDQVRRIVVGLAEVRDLEKRHDVGQRLR